MKSCRKSPVPNQHQCVGKKGITWMFQLLEELFFSACVSLNQKALVKSDVIISAVHRLLCDSNTSFEDTWGEWMLPCLYLQSRAFSDSKGIWVTAHMPCLHISSELFRKAQLLLPAKAPRCFPFHTHLFLYLWISRGRNLPSWISCQGSCCGHLCSRS